MSVGKSLSTSSEYNVGISQIFIPKDLGRDEYIRLCLMSHTVSMIAEDGAMRHRVPVINGCIDELEFPETHDTFGSQVVWIYNTLKSQAIVIGILKSKVNIGDIAEHEFKWRKEYGNDLTEIGGNPETGVINLIVDRDKGATMNLKVTSIDNKGQLNVEVVGNIDVLATNKTAFNQYQGFEVKTTDEEDEAKYASLTQSVGEHIAKSDKFHIRKSELGDSEEPMMLGKTFKSIFDEFINTVAATTVTTALGQMPILNAVQVAEFQKKTYLFLSKIGYLE